MASPFLLVACGVVGLFAGVFVNVLIVRGPGKRSFLPPWTRCAHCDRPPSFSTLIPVAGPLLMDGKCGRCGETIGWWQPVVEVSNALLWMMAALHFGARLDLLAILPFFSGVLALSVIDLLTYRLPDRINLPLLVGSVPLIGIISAVQHRPHDFIWALGGGLGYWMLLGFMWLIHPRGMGFGDVKFARVLGLYLGWVHPVLILYGVMLAGIGGSVVGIAMVVITRNRTKGFPFGPWMAAGCIASIMLSARFTQNF